MHLYVHQVQAKSLFSRYTFTNWIYCCSQFQEIIKLLMYRFIALTAVRVKLEQKIRLTVNFHPYSQLAFVPVFCKLLSLFLFKWTRKDMASNMHLIEAIVRNLLSVFAPIQIYLYHKIECNKIENCTVRFGLKPENGSYSQKD